jgi:hypothetical protein
MTAEQWTKRVDEQRPFTLTTFTFNDIIADLFACERERDEALHDVHQLWEAAKETEDRIETLTSRAQGAGSRVFALTAQVARLREALEGMIIGACAVAVPHGGERAVLQMAVDGARAALATEEEK